MGKILSLQKFQIQKRRRFLARHAVRIDDQIKKYMQINLDATWEGAIQHFCTVKKLEMEQVWDLEEFRNEIYNFLHRELVPGLTEALAKNYWFDPVILTNEWLTDQMISHLINDFQLTHAKTN